jgi:hypothetical protein
MHDVSKRNHRVLTILIFIFPIIIGNLGWGLVRLALCNSTTPNLGCIIVCLFLAYSGTDFRKLRTDVGCIILNLMAMLFDYITAWV